LPNCQIAEPTEGSSAKLIVKSSNRQIVKFNKPWKI
jgi:hypothetical protein